MRVRLSHDLESEDRESKAPPSREALQPMGVPLTFSHAARPIPALPRSTQPISDALSPPLAFHGITTASTLPWFKGILSSCVVIAGALLLLRVFGLINSSHSLWMHLKVARVFLKGHVVVKKLVIQRSKSEMCKNANETLVKSMLADQQVVL